MFLKSLTLKGFKSFAETTTLEFEPGITVVVGPNGSGKSNIVDAVAWVLGAQGPRTVRSSRMEDVIFAGSGKRPALGRAEVSLTIDNSAGLLPIGFSEVTITRTLFRNSGESEYSINGVPCRLLDIQELLSDSGVGRQQHVIVSQGQLDSVLDARPEDRRLIIEEAAGVLKYRRRREKAQRRLEASEANLVRLQDLLREVRRQLRPLERQADAARRHDALADELRALRLYLVGREVSAQQSRLSKARADRDAAAAAEASLKSALSRFDADVLAAEHAAAGDDVDEEATALARLQAVRERARGLHALVVERGRSLARLREHEVDAEVVATLDAEAARLDEELADTERVAAALGPEETEVAQAEQQLADERAAFDEQWAGGAEARGELAALRAVIDRGRAEVSRIEARLAALDERRAALDAEHGRLAAETAGADAVRAATEGAQEAHASAVASRQAAERERQAWTARADALALALDEARARAGAERLAGVDGVVGTLLELVDVDEGWEAAFEAAVGEAIAAVVVDGLDAARRALSHLHDRGEAGTVLALDAGVTPASLALAASAVGAEPVRAHVRARLPSVDGLLDALLATAVAVDGDWPAALDLALAHPGVVAVTRAGDRFAVSGWRAGAGAAAATGVALSEARERIAEGEQALADAMAHEAATSAALAEAQAAGQRLDGAMADMQLLDADLRDVRVESETLATQLAQVQQHLDAEEQRARDLEPGLPARDVETSAHASRTRLDERAADLAARRSQLERRVAGTEARRALLTQRRAEVRARLERLAAAPAHRAVTDGQAAAVERMALVLAGHNAALDEATARAAARRDAAAARRRAAAERLETLRRERATAERQLAEVRERAQRAGLEEAEARVRLEADVESLRRELDTEPERAVAAPCPPLPPGTTAEHRARELERELRLMGPVNPLALQEFEALSDRHQFLEGQLEDVKSGRRELTKVIRAIDGEIVQLFSAAVTDVAHNFEKLFETLFPGGTGRLRLTDPDDLLETGIEVEARPSGKNVRKLSLLSGGERSLTALAFLFAVFRSRPSPFYLLDEVEAALDDVNLHRFLDLVHEFRDEAQLLVVSHQKRTMEAGDCLYGVTMQSGGSSRVISERIDAPA